MSLETEVAALTVATTDLLEAVNIGKQNLDAAEDAAVAAAQAAEAAQLDIQTNWGDKLAAADAAADLAVSNAALTDADRIAAAQSAADADAARIAAEAARDAAQLAAGMLPPLVIVASGQSNMDGAGSAGTMPAENPAVRMFDLTTRQFRTLSYVNRISRKNVNNGAIMTIPSAANRNNLAFSFCHAAHKATRRDVYLIIVSNGGTHIGRWVGSDASSVSSTSGPWGPAGTPSPLYVELKGAVEEALAIIGTTKIDAFLWHQGETLRPGFPLLSDYASDFNTLQGKLKAETWWSADTQLIAGELVIGSYYQNADINNDVFRALNDNGDPFTKAVSGEGLAMNAAISSPDSVHYSGQALYEFGLRYWRAFLGDKTALARRADPVTTEYGVKTTVYDWTAKKYGIAETIDPLAGRILNAKRPAPVRSGGGRESGQRAVNNFGCAVTHNADGTFTVTPNGFVIQNWQFDVEDFWQVGPGLTRTVESGQVPKIIGNVDLTKREKFRLWLDNDTSANLNIGMTPRLTLGTNVDENLEINWGDGTIESGATGLRSRTYASAYTGWVIVSAPGICEITSVQSTDGRWRSPMSNFQALSQMTLMNFGADNRLFGDLRDLPQSLTTLTLAGNNTCTWDFTGLPNLKNLNVTGANTINAPRRYSEMRAFTRLILDGADRTTAQIDDLLIALATVPTWDGTRDIFLNYTGQAPRSSASDAAVADLAAKGVTVSTNP